MTCTPKISEAPGSPLPSKAVPPGEDSGRKRGAQDLATISNAPHKISALVDDLLSDHHLKLRIAFENEFYLLNSGHTLSREFLKELDLELSKLNIDFTLTVESGHEQFEISTRPSEDVVAAAEKVIQIRRCLYKISSQCAYRVSFVARPWRDRPGSGLHVHTSLHSIDGGNLFAKSIGDRGETRHMLQAIAGLLASMPGSMTVFAPSKDSYRRYWEDEKSARCHYDFVPSFISWGGDNRTVAIRIPESSAAPERRRLEHRVPCSNSDPLSVTAVIIAGIKHGLENRLHPTEPKIWGLARNAADTLVEFPKSLAEAIEASRNCTIVRPLFSPMV